MLERDGLGGNEQENKNPDIHIISLFGAFNSPILIIADFRGPADDRHALQVIRLEKFLDENSIERFRGSLHREEDETDLVIKEELFRDILNYLTADNPNARGAGSVVFDCLDQGLDEFFAGDAWFRLETEMNSLGSNLKKLRNCLLSVKKFEDEQLRRLVLGMSDVMQVPCWESEKMKKRRLEAEALEFEDIVIIFHFDLGIMAVFDIRESRESQERGRLMHMEDFFDAEQRVSIRSDIVGGSGRERRSASKTIMKAVIGRLNKARPEIAEEQERVDIVIYGGPTSRFLGSDTWRKVYSHVSGRIDSVNLKETMSAMLEEEKIYKERRKLKRDSRRINQDPF